MALFSFPRHRRLLTPAAFKHVFDHARYRVRGDHCLLLACENGTDQARLGLVVAKRRVRHAVTRNCIKRHAREGFRLRHDNLAGLDIVLLVRASWHDARAESITAELNPLWDKLLAKRDQA